MLPVLTRYVVFSGTTAEVERVNALIQRVLVHRSSSLPETDTKVFKLIADRKHYDEGKVIGIAQELWEEHFGQTRKSCNGETVRKGINRKISDFASASSGKFTESGFLRHRGRAVAAAAGAMTPDDISDVKKKLKDCKSLRVWKDSHNREKKFLKTKRSLQKVDALRNGSLLASEVSDDLRELEFDRRSKEMGNKRDRDNAARLALSKTKQRALRMDSLRGMSVFIEEECDGPKVNGVVEALSLKRVDSIFDLADILVVTDPGAAGKKVAYSAGAVGAYVMSDATFATGSGAFVKYHSGVKTPRKIWFDERFKEKHADVHKIFTNAFKVKGSKWKGIDDRESFVKEHAKKSHKVAVIAALCTRGDKGALPPKARVFNNVELLKLVARIDRGSSAMGVCGR